MVALAATIGLFVKLITSSNSSFLILYQLELSDSDEAFRKVMLQNNLSDVLMEKIIYNDYLYIIAYTILFYLSIKVVIYSDRFKKRSFLGIFTIIPGFFDTVQNLLALEIVNHSGLNANFIYYQYLVWVKWITITPFIFLVLWALKIQLLALQKKRSPAVENKVNLD